MKKLIALLVLLGFGTPSMALLVYLQKFNTSCMGNDGVILTTVVGGVPPYTYDIGAGPGGPEFYNLAPGSYTVTVTDNLGAVGTATTEVAQGGAPPSDVTLIDYLGLGGLEACWNGQCDGGFRLHLPRQVGGFSFITTPSMSYIELPEDEPSNIDSWVTYEFLGACGGQTVQLTISNNCGTGISNIPIESVPVPVVNVLAITGSCNGADDGTLSAEVALAQPASGWNHWSLVAVDVPAGGNEVEPTPSVFNIGTEAFQLMGLHPGTWDLFFTTGENDGSNQQACAYAVPFVVPDLGTDCANVSGTLHFETDADCAQDGLELGLPYQMLRVTPGPLYGITDGDGQYDIAVPFGSYVLEQINPDAVQICPVPAPIPFSVSSGNDAVIDIADSLLTPFNMGLHLVNTISRVGMLFQYAAHLSNSNGYTGENVVVTLDYDPTFTFVSASPAPSSSTPGQVQWSIPVLAPFGHRHFGVIVQVPPDPLLLGNSYTATATATSTTSEANTTNNASSRTHTIVASYDPNDKQAFTSSQQNNAVYLLDADTHIDYVIRFQNTGTDTAFNITVTDTISPLLDMASLQLLGASHPFTPHIATGNVLEFRFADVLLPDSNVNEVESHGYIAFRLRPVDGIAIGSTIDNAADIFFDFNEPVRTNTASVDAGITTDQPRFILAGISIAPVPTTDLLSIGIGGATLQSITVLALDGREVLRSGGAAVLDVSALPPAAYVLLARTADGRELRSRFVKK